MGTVKERKYQEILAVVSLKVRNGKTVPVRLRPEPNNSMLLDLTVELNQIGRESDMLYTKR